MIRIPYGTSNFERLVTDNYHYVDRTSYIELLENLGERHVFMVRPRRFGKSLFISTLQYYYSIEHKAKFKELFGPYYIGQHPTPLANSYLVIQLSFSAIDTKTPETTYRDFLNNVKYGVRRMMSAHQDLFKKPVRDKVFDLNSPAEIIQHLFDTMDEYDINEKIYILIDEYDHFANELLAFDFANFKNIVSKNGFVRKFYEMLKEGTLQGRIDRIFITGVTPITLDSLTSGFNIASKLTTAAELNEMFGFTEAEVLDILEGIEIPEADRAPMLKELAFWYNGYLFNWEGKERVYNPDMVLYFAKKYIAAKKFPNKLLDTNIASDYRKVRNLFKLDSKEGENIAIIKKLLSEGSTSAQLTEEYSFEKTWTKDDLISLLFYQGILTIKSEWLDRITFHIPNAVIRQLYFQYFQQITLEEANIQERGLDIWEKIEQLAVYNNIQPLMDLTQDILAQLAIEDRAHYNELTYKAIFTALFYSTNIFKIFSELEVRKSATRKGRVDLLLLERQPFEIPYQFVFELKYIRRKELNKWATVKAAAILQLQAYLQHDERLQQTKNLKAYVLLFSSQKVEAVVV